LNILMPLARRPETLSRLIGEVLGVEPPTMLPITGEATISVTSLSSGSVGRIT